jgi:Macrocin-O-methyltransferase (TylF)
MLEEVETASAAALYLDLMKRVLTDGIYVDDPLAWFAPYRIKPTTRRVKRALIVALQHFLARYRIRLVQFNAPWSYYETATPEELEAMREGGTYWPARAHTMIGLKRLDNLQYCAETVIREGIPGDLIETGVWRGGACIFMRAVLKAYGEKERTVWVADSFEGLPPPDVDTYPADIDDRWHTYSQWFAISKEQVERNFRRYGLLDQQVRFLKGWFKDTLPSAPIERLAVLRLDGDMYESTIQALEALYPKLSLGGFVIVDDYFLKPCAQAVHDFRRAHGIEDEIIDIDGRGSYWRRMITGQ